MRTAYSQGRDASPGLVRLPLALTIGAAGAVTNVRGFGLSDATPPVFTSTGRYTLTLDQQYGGAFVYVMITLKQATGVATLVGRHISGNGNDTATIIIETAVAAGTVTNPATGDIIYVELAIDENGLVP
jgi:hypothetical protein